MTTVENLEFVVYQIRSVAQVQFEQWKSSKVIDVSSIYWEKVNGDFLDHLFTFEMRETSFKEI